MKRLSIVIPCRNEAAAIPGILASLDQWAAGERIDCSVIVVDDGSDDETANALKGGASQLKRNGFEVRHTRLARPSGKDAAILCGMTMVDTRTDFVAVMDGDGQHPVSSLGQLVELARTGAYVAVAEPQAAIGSTYVRRLTHRLAKLFLSRESVRTDFSVIRRTLVPDVIAMMLVGDAYRDALTWLAAPVEKIEYEVGGRIDGTTSRFTLSAFVALGAQRSLSRGREIVIFLTFLRTLTLLLCGVIAFVLYFAGMLNWPTMIVLALVLLSVAAVSEVFIVFVLMSVYARGTPRPRFQVSHVLVDAKGMNGES